MIGQNRHAGSNVAGVESVFSHALILENRRVMNYSNYLAWFLIHRHCGQHANSACNLRKAPSGEASAFISFFVSVVQGAGRKVIVFNYRNFVINSLMEFS